MSQDASSFAKEVIQRSHAYAESFASRNYGDAPRPLKGEALIGLLRTNMWREYMLGVQAPAKLMTLMGEDCIELKHLLGGQIVDEMRHSATFSKRVTELGGNGDVTSYEPTPEDWKLYYATTDFDDPAELVTSLNCCGEVILQHTFKKITERRKGAAVFDDLTADIVRQEMVDDYEELPPVVDEKTAAVLRDSVIPDEGKHVKIGRAILTRFATSDEVMRRCLEVQRRKLEALDAAHTRTVSDAKRLTTA
jgi:rubrerythrin